MGTQHRILFAVPGLAGHVGPSLAITKHLIAEGHHIGYVIGEPVRRMIEKAGVREFYARPRHQQVIMHKATLRRISSAVLELLRQPRYTRASEGVMRSYRSCGGARTAAGLLIRLAETRQPILRKPGAPVTLHDISDLPDFLQ